MASLKLEDIAVATNLCDKLDEQELVKISQQVLDGFNRDVASRARWDADNNAALHLAELPIERKYEPWEDASNIYFPLVTDAVIQFGSYVTPEFVRGDKVVEVSVVGKDLHDMKSQRARRVSRYMSQKFINHDINWVDDLDHCFQLTALFGTMIRKVYYDPIKGDNVSLTLLPEEVYINNNVKHLSEAERITHKFTVSQNYLYEMMAASLFCKYDLAELAPRLDEGYSPEDNQHELLEQHCFYDFDEDGYAEPCIITIHKQSGKVLRITARFDMSDVRKIKNKVLCIKPTLYFNDLHFIRSMGGGFYSLGFGALLSQLNHTVNSTLNKLMDAGTLANMQCGFIGAGLRINGDTMDLAPGEWKTVETAVGDEIKSQIVPLNYKEPSNVLFQLLGMLIDVSKRLSSVTDIMKGDQLAQNAPATSVLTLVQQGMKMYNAIYGRLHRAMAREYQMHYKLYSQFLDRNEYVKIADEASVDVVLEDFVDDGFLNIVPVSSPSLSSDAARMFKAKALVEMANGPLGAHLNLEEITKTQLDVLDMPNMDKLLLPPQAPPPDPEEELGKVKMAIEQAKLEMAQHQAVLAQQNALVELSLKAEKIAAEIKNIEADATLKIAQAEAVEPGMQLQKYQQYLDVIASQHAQMQAEVDNLHRAQELDLRRQQVQQPVVRSEEPQNAAQPTQDIPAVSDPMAGPPSDVGPVGGSDIPAGGIPQGGM